MTGTHPDNGLIHRGISDWGKGMKIVMIDDDRELGELTAKVLQREGFDVHYFDHAGDGITHARDDVPDLILMDMMMPQMSGEDAIRTIKADAELQHVPILCLTGLVAGAETEIGESGININGKYYPALGKPFDKDQLLASIDYYLNR